MCFHRDRWGVDALALDPQDDSKVYVALGAYTNELVAVFITYIRSNTTDQDLVGTQTTAPSHGAQTKVPHGALPT